MQEFSSPQYLVANLNLAFETNNLKNKSDGIMHSVSNPSIITNFALFGYQNSLDITHDDCF
jgi:hypothetical protein